MTVLSKTESTTPAWWDEIRIKFMYGEASWFLLHGGGVFDYVDIPGHPVERWITNNLGPTPETTGLEVIVNVSLDRGIGFEQPWMRKLFTTTLGLKLDDDPDVAMAQSGGTGEIRLPEPDKPADMVEVVLDFLRKSRCIRRGDLAALTRFSCDECGGLEKNFVDNADDEPITTIAVRCASSDCNHRYTIDAPLVADGARSAALIIEDVDLLMPAVPESTPLSLEMARLLKMLHRAATEPALSQALVIMLTPTLGDVHKRLRAKGSGIHPVKVPLPDFQARLRFINYLQVQRPELQMEMATQEFAALTAGLYRRHIEDIVLHAGDDILTRAIALDRQRELMDSEYGKVLERLEPEFGFDAIGGYDELKNHLLTRVIAPMRSGDPKKLLWVGMGALISGPPGVAKTDLGMALAYEAKINCVRIKNLKEKWVGASEGNLDMLIEGVEMFAPCIVVIDEFDKAGFGSSESEGGDHPVDASLRKRLQEWMSDTRHRGRIYVAAFTNYPQVIDPAIKRPGRLDLHAPMLLPDTAEWRGDILARILARNGYDADPVVLAEAFGDKTAEWSGADLGYAVTKACGTVALDGIPLMDALMDALSTIRHSTTPATRRMAEYALDDCNDLSLVPPKERTKRLQREQAAAVEPREPVAPVSAPEPIRRGRRGAI